MKLRTVILILCICIFAFLAYKYIHTSSVISSPTPLPTPTTVLQNTNFTLTYHDIVYDYAFFIAGSPAKLKLIPNFTDPIRGTAIAKAHQCVSAINGGFYSTTNAPLGAFVSEEYTQPKPLTSNLFNGFFSFTNTKATITNKFDSSYTSILQSGPLLFLLGHPLPLAIQNDEHARRSIVAITDDDRILFITFYIHDSIYNGPLLADLPVILNQFATIQKISITAALNLDGGSATFFKSPDIELPELTSIGSMFCLQK